MVDKDKIEAITAIRAEAVGDLETLQREHAALKMRVSELEVEGHQQLERINQLLVDKETLQMQVVEHKEQLLVKERESAELKATLALREGQEGQELEALKGQLASEQRRSGRLGEQVTELQEQIRQLQTKMQKAKEFIRQQDRLFKETRSTLESKGGSYEEAVVSLQSELRSRDEEVAKLRAALDDVARVRRREQTLMASAWYELGRRVHREGLRSATQQPPWLTLQRRLADVQRRRN